MQVGQTRRVLSAVALSVALMLSLACGAGSGGNPNGYAEESVTWGAPCDPMQPIPEPVFRVGQHPCVRLLLAGYYTAGTLEARWMHGDEVFARTTIEFSGAKALLQRLMHGGAYSEVTFTTSGMILPASDDYRLVLVRSGREVRTHHFRVVP